MRYKFKYLLYFSSLKGDLKLPKIIKHSLLEFVLLQINIQCKVRAWFHIDLFTLIWLWNYSYFKLFLFSFWFIPSHYIVKPVALDHFLCTFSLTFSFNILPWNVINWNSKPFLLWMKRSSSFTQRFLRVMQFNNFVKHVWYDNECVEK